MSHKNFKKTIEPTVDITKKVNNVRSFAEAKEDWRKYCSLWRSKPDLFIDFIKPDRDTIDLFFYQRVMLRILFRYKKVFFTFTRGTSKSFIQILALYLKCIFFPGTRLFICAPNKEQAAKISKENIEKIWEYFPILRGEVSKPEFQKDYTRLTFHNGSKLDVVQVADAERGGRRNGGSIEEIVDPKMKKDTLHSVVIPLMANNRRSKFQGQVDKKGEIHKNQWYITTSGTRQSFAYEKMMEVLGEMVNGKSAFAIGASYDLACMHDLLEIDFINDLKEQPTFNPLSFAREYESVWTGSSDNSLVQLDDLNACRVLTKAEEKHSGEKNVEYILAYDVARAEGKNAAVCALCVIKIIPRGTSGTYQKHMVNMYSFSGTHFLEQAIFVKKKVNDFKAAMLVVDANGQGKGLVDILVTECDENPAYSVVNDDSYNKYKTDNSIPILYALSSNTKENKASNIHNVFIGMISTRAVKILHSESQAKADIKENVDPEKASRILLPFAMTDLMCEEIMNLEHKQSGKDTQVKQISRSINKDKFSAFQYGLFYIYNLEMKNSQRKRETVNAASFFLAKAPTSRLKR